MAEVVGCLFGESPEGGLSGVASTCLSLSCSPAASHCSSAGPQPNQKQTRSGQHHTTCMYVHIYVGRKAWIRTIHGWNCAKRGSMLRATIHGLSAHSVNRADRRAQSVDSGNPWIELNVAWIRQSCGSFTKGARSRCSWPVLCTRARRVVCACAYRPRNRKYAVYLSSVVRKYP